MSKKANIVIIGGGIIGVSIAYHLADMGVEGIVLIDKGDLDHNDGSTSHAPGGVRVLTPSDFFTTLGSRSAAAYKKLPLVDGQQHYFEKGSVQVATTPERLESYYRMVEMGMTMRVESYVLSARESAEKQPLLDPNKILGGFYIPSAGIVKTSLVATSMRRIAEATGRLTSVADTKVLDIETDGGRVRRSPPITLPCRVLNVNRSSFAPIFGRRSSRKSWASTCPSIPVSTNTFTPIELMRLTG